MPSYRLKFSRRVVQTDTFEELIEAPSLAAAKDAALSMSCDMDRSCPDDVTSTPHNVGEWNCFVLEEVQEAA